MKNASSSLRNKGVLLLIVLSSVVVLLGNVSSGHNAGEIIFGDRLGMVDNVVFVIATFLEIAALGIIVLASIHALKRLLVRWFKRQQLIDYREVIRLEFGLSLALALEFLLAADIVATAIAPTWEDLGKLAVVATIRTVLNYFLEQEVEKLEHKSKKTKLLVQQIRGFGKDHQP